MAFWDDFDFGSFLSGLGDIGKFVGGMGGFVSPLIGWYLNNSGGGGPNYPMPQQMPDPSEYMKQWMGAFEPPDLSEYFAGMNEMFAQQQEDMKQQQMKGLARQAVATRKGLQNQGVYEGGAVSEDALANLMGVDDRDLFRQALKAYGADYGWV